MLGGMFAYVETKEVMTCILNHFDTYYRKVKDLLKSYHVTESIKKDCYISKKQITIRYSL